MTDFLALDLSASHAALFAHDGLHWQRLGAVPLSDPGLARHLAAMISDAGITGGNAVSLLPHAQVVSVTVPAGEAAGDVLADRGVTSATHAIHQHIAGSGAVFHAVPLEILAETEQFLTALGLTPLGSGAALDGGGAQVWFGRADGTVPNLPAPPPDTAELARDTPVSPRDRALEAARRAPTGTVVKFDDDDPDLASRREKVAAALLRKAKGHGSLAMRRAIWRGTKLSAGLAASLVVGALLYDHYAPSGDPTRPTPGIQRGMDTVSATAPPFETALPPDELAERVQPPGAPESGSGIALGGTLFTPQRRLQAVAPGDDLSELVHPGIDMTDRIDAVALPVPASPTSRTIALAPPSAPEETFIVDENGLVIPTPQGRRAPDGYTVVAGRPGSVPPERPEWREEDLPLRIIADRTSLAADDPLRTLSPRQRPDFLVASNERAQLGGKTRSELGYLRPDARSETEQESAPEMPPTAQAVATGPRPTVRTQAALRSFRLARTNATPTADGSSIEAAAVQEPSAPSPKNVQSSATSESGIDLGDINLLGTYGGSRSRRALVRLPNGRVVNVAVGDRMDGGRVAAIDNGRLDYTKSGTTHVLTMPRL